MCRLSKLKKSAWKCVTTLTTATGFVMTDPSICILLEDCALFGFQNTIVAEQTECLRNLKPVDKIFLGPGWGLLKLETIDNSYDKKTCGNFVGSYLKD